MSVQVKGCATCGQVNPSSSGFCPVCGAPLSDVPASLAPWTVRTEFPPLPEVLTRRRRRRLENEGQGVGFAWVGFAFIGFPVLLGARTGIMGGCAAIGVGLVLLGYWMMRRDAHSVAVTGVVTNLLAILTLTAIVAKLLTSGGPTPVPIDVESAAVSLSPTAGVAAPSPSAVIDHGSVPMFRGNAAHTGVNTGPGPENAVIRGWRNNTSGTVYVSPAIDDGRVYLGTKTGFLIALDEGSGNELWRTNLQGDIVRSSPAVIDGNVLVGVDRTFYSVDGATGQPRWAVETPLIGASSPTVDGGVIFLGFPTGAIYALNADTGANLWHMQAEGAILASPTLAGNLVVVGTDAGKVYGLDRATGQSLWKFDASGSIYGSAAFAAGTVYVTTSGDAGRFTIAIDSATGRQQWSYPAGGKASPTVVDGIVLVADTDGGLYALDPSNNGDPRWLFPTGHSIDVAPVVANGTAYVASGSTLIAVDLASRSESWRYAVGYRIEASPVVVDGRVIVVGGDGNVDALVGASLTPVASPAPV